MVRWWVGEYFWLQYEPRDCDDSRREIFPLRQSRPDEKRDEARRDGQRKKFGGEGRQYCVGHHTVAVPWQRKAVGTIDKLPPSTRAP